MGASFSNEDPSDDVIVRNLKLAQVVALQAMTEGKHPFGSILIGPDHSTVLMTQGNVNTVNHAESTLARRAAEAYDEDYLWNCTLYTTLEPCAMCAGTIYWANIGRVVFGAEETELKRLTGNHHENPTMELPCRTVFASGQKGIRVWGPIPSLKDEMLEPHLEFWNSDE